MTKSIGRGLGGSLNARVDHEILQLARENTTLRRARYSFGRRLLRAIVVGRSFTQFLIGYCVIQVLALIGDWAINRYTPCWLPEYSDSFDPSFLRDLASYLIAGQVGILAIVSVAVAVVTLLSERSDGASVNTDIRLYYVESYSYELAISGVALLLILTVQLFWPLHHIIGAIGIGGADDWFKLALAALHTLWFCVNLVLFLQFITTTLRFVEPNAREDLRERYSANEVIPRDTKSRLKRHLYANAPSQMFGRDALQEGAGVSFGYQFDRIGNVETEITATFRVPVKLVDVYLLPMQWALAHWRRRVRQQSQQRSPKGRLRPDDHLAVTPNFDDVLEGQCDLVRREGDVALTSLEKWVIRRSLRFAPVSSRDDAMPTPDDFLEQLIDKLVGQIELGAATGFRAALDEVIRYHRFLLAAQNTKDAAGNPFNLAEVGGWFLPPYVGWVRQYRRAFVAAADKIGSDTSFIDRLSRLAAHLVPAEGLEFSPHILQTLIELGLHEVVSMEDWVTRRAVIGAAVEPGASPALAGSDKRAYENALIEFVAGWEYLAHTLISSLSYERRPRGPAAAVEAQWTNFTKGFPVFQTHLYSAAHFLAAAVWNDDALGTDRFRDLLLRWPQPFYENLQEASCFANTLSIIPELTRRDWSAVQAEAAARMRYGWENVLPGLVSGILLWELYCDTVCVSGLIFLHWYATDQQPSNIATQTAILTLRCEKRPADGSDLTGMPEKSVFRLLLDFIVRYGSSPRLVEGRNSATIDGLVGRLTDLAKPRMVSGRIYGGFGIGGFDTLRPAFLAAMAANLQPQDDADVATLVEDLKTDALFASYEAVRDFIWTIEQLVHTLDLVQGDKTYLKAARAFGPDLDVVSATVRLKAMLAAIATAFEELHTRRLREAPLDEDRLALVRRLMSDTVLSAGPGIACFRNFVIRRDNSDTIPMTEFDFGDIDKGAFTVPKMSGVSFDDLPGMFVEVLRSRLSELVWRDLYHRPKRVIQIDISASTDPFWRRVIAEASSVGSDPMVLVPFKGIGEEVHMASSMGHRLHGLNVSRDRTISSSRGAGYMGTVEGIPVYSAQAITQHAILCSGRLLHAIDYRVVYGADDVADFSFIDGNDPQKSRVLLKVGQHIEWGDDVFVEFNLCRE